MTQPALGFAAVYCYALTEVASLHRYRHLPCQSIRFIHFQVESFDLKEGRPKSAWSAKTPFHLQRCDSSLLYASRNLLVLRVVYIPYRSYRRSYTDRSPIQRQGLPQHTKAVGKTHCISPIALPLTLLECVARSPFLSAVNLSNSACALK